MSQAGLVMQKLANQQPAPGMQAATRAHNPCQLSQSQSKHKWIGARQLHIDWMENPTYWVYTQVPGQDPCSPKIEVAELRKVCWFYVFGRLDIKSLVKETCYGAFFVYKLKDRPTGLDQANALVKFLEDNEDNVNDNDESSSKAVFIAKKRTGPDETRQFPQTRPDGWLEVLLRPVFYIEAGDDGVVHMQLKSTTSVWKTGLLVRGIEVRPFQGPVPS